MGVIGPKTFFGPTFSVRQYMLPEKITDPSPISFPDFNHLTEFFPELEERADKARRAVA